ncbi:MarR family winged helix-turn-helix transcriptional regulator [Arhodomonas sp. AD133]|uniref:MarR family winged helix-turn-helix transcriptional regulator n=1 Tax=Arhodomonas sp. AD133 TaxID=3415009 RepID=UPI003EBD2BC4
MSTSPDQPQDNLADGVTAIIARLANALRSHEWQAARPRGLTPTQAHALHLLAQREPARVRISDVARELGVSPATASDTIATLERKCLITRAPSTVDRRAVELRLTPEGHDAVRAVAHAGAFLGQAAADLPVATQTTLFSGLLELATTLEATRMLPPARMCPTCTHLRRGSRGAPHYCTAYERPLNERELRVDCPRHEPAPETVASTR